MIDLRAGVREIFYEAQRFTRERCFAVNARRSARRRDAIAENAKEKTRVARLYRMRRPWVTPAPLDYRCPCCEERFGSSFGRNSHAWLKHGRRV